jgi:colanic acid biosynthesis protein WcaH
MADSETKKISPDDFIEVVKKTPLVSIDLIIKNNLDQVLLGLRNNEPAKGFWFVPGGRILKNELIAEAFERITEEELGISLAYRDSIFFGSIRAFIQREFCPATRIRNTLRRVGP